MDDLLDLSWNSSSTNTSSKNGLNPSYNAFDSLAAAARTNTANYHGLNSARSPSPAAIISPVSAKSSGNSVDDAFSSLFGDSTASARHGASKQNSLSMQQRLEVQKSGSGSSSGPHGPGSSQAAGADLWDFDMLSSAPASASSASSKHNGSSSPVANSGPFDDLDAFAPSSKSVITSPLSTQASSIHTDDFLGVLSQPVSAFERSRTFDVARAASPMMAPTPLRASEARTKSASSTRPPSRAVAARTPSPPPHILGQVVAMGFSLQQARLALAATLQSGATAGTDSQWDVQAAVEVLASDGAANAERARSPRSAKNTTTKTSIGDRKLQQGFQDDEMDEYERKEARRAQGRAKERGAEGSHRRGSPSVSPGVIDRQSDDQSPDLLAQASSIGFSVLKSANAYWKTSKAQIAKAVEENKFLAATTDRAGSGRTTPNTGRPKWMTADVEDGETGERPAARSDVAKGKMPQQPSFSDTDGGHAEVPQIRGARQRSDSPPQRKQQPVANLWDEAVDVLAPHPSDRPAAKSHEVSQPKPHLKPPEKEKVAYVSPHRRKAPTPSPSSNTPSSNGLNTAHFRNGASKPTPRPQIPTRAKVTATHSQLAASKDARTRGNEHFKLGRYGEAVEAYTAALTPLPDNHLGRIPALNNRANARLKIGEERKAGEDATAVITLLLADSAKPDAAKKDDYTAVLAELEGTETSAGEERLDAHDALGKALSRRARGHEAGEKWRLAMLDWQMLAELGDQRVLKSGGGMRVVSEGLARCRKVVEGPVEPIQKVQAKPPAARVPSKPRAASSAPTAKPSAALTALRQGNQQAEADESEAIRVKDNVDAKITSWRAGKETNLRALIGSLDNVLWEELGWKKVGMHELLTESQLKVKYVRAISKVHPDKIGNNASVEQRMIAGAVFSTLSDAWAAMK